MKPNLLSVVSIDNDTYNREQNKRSILFYAEIKYHRFFKSKDKADFEGDNVFSWIPSIVVWTGKGIVDI